MAYAYRFHDHTADVWFTAEADTLSELFLAAALAMFETMTSLDSVRPAIEFEISLHAENPENLLFDFLSELVFFKDSEAMLFSVFDVAVKEEDGGYGMKAAVSGELIDLNKHELKVDVKAVTLHKFSVEKKGGRWAASVILDI